MSIETGSLLDRLRTERDRAMSDKKLVLEIPGWSGMLFAEYHPIPWEEMTRIIQSDSDDPETALNVNIDALIAACFRLLVLDDGERKSLADVLRGQGEEIQGEVMYNNGYVDLLPGVEPAVDTARARVLAVFGASVSPQLSIGSHASQLMGWMTGESQIASEQLVGK